MRIITRKGEITEEVRKCFQAYNENNSLQCCVDTLNSYLLQHKVKFPLLEFCGTTFFENLPEDQQIPFCDQIAALGTIGGNVIIGIILQKRLPNHFEESIEKATEYIIQGAEWYVCDIIGERVFGYSLLNEPYRTLLELKRLSVHENNWVVRSLGPACHYAIKKGLGKEEVKPVFEILLSMANRKDQQIRQGIGWAAKTTAKFHPDIIETYQKEIQNKRVVSSWFRTKVRIGLERYEYVNRNRS
ncbi:DNA alkylation repair protein [Leptobacterium flavescens]|uniref:DNA alkylation repair protein n=1 Tax=Leptobacterium flavescens TaxID=472055 RepID=A0A6P0UPV8_9FLAO|nr:DNA alkylation repair protein [Leptobacterium flavescens]NER12416.1 DNA alkylation repair protein [Leptobacterium flavescens]